ncbi:hypothetical protein ACFUIW_12480 [Streptomyces sp. NPDC057245]|uniref:hypothetical protein n=1 Tax=Streptomyces sp. NPDC057245 TaxID=3346065 RepID=UPI0036273475
MWLRRFRDALVRRRTGTTAALLADRVREPDPYVWPRLSPYDARWRRWHKRCRAAGRYLPWPGDEPCWAAPDRPPASPWQTEDDVVRPYVLRP